MKEIELWVSDKDKIIESYEAEDNCDNLKSFISLINRDIFGEDYEQ